MFGTENNSKKNKITNLITFWENTSGNLTDKNNNKNISEISLSDLEKLYKIPIITKNNINTDICANIWSVEGINAHKTIYDTIIKNLGERQTKRMKMSTKCAVSNKVKSFLKSEHVGEAKKKHESESSEFITHEALRTLNLTQPNINLKTEARTKLENKIISDITIAAPEKETGPSRFPKIKCLAMKDSDFTDSIKQEHECLKGAYKRNPKMVKVRGRKKGKVTFLLPEVFSDKLCEEKDIVYE